ncbi:MAG: heavy-metal-associated domain-containing protein [Candidatus Promineifilaceae bacterium]
MADVSFTVAPLSNPINRTSLTQVLKQISGVTAVRIDPATFKIAISYDPQKADTFTLVTAVQDAGYNVVTEPATLFVGGMSCASCAFHVETALTDIPGVVTVDVNLQTGETVVTIADNEIGLNELYAAIQEAGYYLSMLLN